MGNTNAEAAEEVTPGLLFLIGSMDFGKSSPETMVLTIKNWVFL
jgi:hypothetical protein